MALSDLFKPKWKNSNPNVREKAIINVTNQKVLSELLNGDNHVL